MKPIRIVFVCLGNIVRSPLAEHMFMDLAKQAGLEDKYQTDSAGTAAYHIGESPDLRMRQVASEFGLVYDGKGRQFLGKDFEDFDLIVPMDTDNQFNVLKLAGHKTLEKKVSLMRDFDPKAAKNGSVPDPYYGGIDGFVNVYKIVERSCQGLLEAIEKGKIQFEYSDS
ncbi:MAG: low molecular weight phosphotyrosine protein phosphatase [Chloroflexi bacterium]|jgi:protein-tyrosine phosphatase|nr:low molecular weight phosphotyrosine protein phosphatase [Chloroflexota bacterium]MBT3669714.1 low molecular weight phosphotyrosine protein phosphatase [Chloroflexota bacterium]MBT4004111.1 low molecular weight phosphotyrosine protein phosphatase [Chloroflexota bacterium]MBT4305194.1 low molecular weight phosphotyrosine protein phosphatase [Chloroflexota bacterium]MBT4534883.1 low molecular weight phosphotyrosine protein phosphatase [Chloroflexota bacterium]